MKILEVKNLVKTYGSLRAVDKVSFDIEKGEIFGLLGPNGAGKTTLISSIITLEKFQEGDIFVCGKSVQRNASLIKSFIGFMPQDIIVHGYFTVKEIVKFYSGFCGVWPNLDRIDYLLKKFDLWDKKDKKVRYLSGGMKRRLLIVKALVHSPKLLLLDEPTAGVDIQLRNSIWEFIKDIKKECSILFTTHYLEEAENLCDRVAFINKGKIQQMGPTLDLISQLTTRRVLIKYTKNIEIKNQYYKGKSKDNYESFSLPYSFTVGNLLKELNLKQEYIEDLKVKEGSLEDIFKSVVNVKKK
ncbi:MAG: ABC transporter ATP-binding protein [Bdellovibrionales bacterium]|nr:ABC transporter ATP-binding protein [Bdellovibrionales bacterium]